MWLPNGHLPQGGDEYLLQCFNCQKMKFAWNSEKETGHCLSAACDARVGGERNLRRLYQNGGELSPRSDPLQSTPIRDSNFISASSSPECSEYLRSRSVSTDLADECGALYRDLRVWFPIRNVVDSSKSPLLMSRSIVPGEKGWRSSRGHREEYLFGKLPSAGGTIVLVEGIFDVLSPGLWGRAVAVCGTVVGPGVRMWLLSNYSKITTWFDPDAFSKAGSLAKTLYEDMEVLEVRVKLTGIYEGAPEPGSCSPEKAARILLGV